MFLLKINQIKLNPDNPRFIKDDKFKKLVKSIEEFPEMLKLRPIIIDEDNMILGGNMRFKACEHLKMKEVWVEKAENLTPEQKNEFIVKDNVGFGEWDWELLGNLFDEDQLGEWGLDLKIDNLKDGEEIEYEKSLQLEPPKEYIMIIAEPNSEEWEKLKEKLKLKMVRRGGYKKGSPFDAVSLERVIEVSDFMNRYADSNTK